MDGETRIPGVTAVVCNFNGEAYLPECLRSVLDQEGVDEVLVVDDASTDGSVALVRERFPAVRVIELPVNGGPCIARNAGMRAARNRWVLAVDNDANLLPDTLRRLEQAILEHPGAVAAQPRSVYADEPSRVHYDGGAFHYVGLYSLRNFGRPLTEAVGTGVLEVDGLIAICILFDREAVHAVGGYDESFFILFEDYDLSLRLRIAGHTLLSVEEALVHHRGGTPGISFRGDEYPRFRAYYHSRNRWLLLYKNYSWRTLLAAAPGILIYELVWGLFTIKNGHLKAHVAGKVSFLGELGRARPKRRAIQASRRLRDRDLLVGGPLTFSPQLVATKAAKRVTFLFGRSLRFLWWLARPLAG